MVVQQSNFNEDWHTIWLAFAIYALVIAVAFAVFCSSTKHNPEVVVEQISH
jgi:NHS family xanthosine MFS transporter